MQWQLRIVQYLSIIFCVSSSLPSCISPDEQQGSENLGAVTGDGPVPSTIASTVSGKSDFAYEIPNYLTRMLGCMDRPNVPYRDISSIEGKECHRLHKVSSVKKLRLSSASDFIDYLRVLDHTNFKQLFGQTIHRQPVPLNICQMKHLLFSIHSGNNPSLPNQQTKAKMLRDEYFRFKAQNCLLSDENNLVLFTKNIGVSNTNDLYSPLLNHFYRLNLSRSKSWLLNRAVAAGFLLSTSDLDYRYFSKSNFDPIADPDSAKWQPIIANTFQGKVNLPSGWEKHWHTANFGVDKSLVNNHQLNQNISNLRKILSNQFQGAPQPEVSPFILASSNFNLVNQDKIKDLALVVVDKKHIAFYEQDGKFASLSPLNLDKQWISLDDHGMEESDPTNEAIFLKLGSFADEDIFFLGEWNQQKNLSH